jgi:transcriptional regulator with XRE-family HTH domain
MHPKYQEVIKLRRQGKSYREIAKTAGVSKNSVSRRCKGLKLSKAAQKILEKKSNYPKELFRKYNQLKARNVRSENQKIKKEAAKEIRPLSKYALKLIGATLYWGEGWKRENPGKYHGICFVNSDPNMVKLFLHFLREVIQVPEEKLGVNIRIHPNIDTPSVINFWSKVTKIPKERFHISTQISRLSRGKRPKNSLPYGTLKLSVNDRRKFQQIKGWIDGLIRQI